MPPEKTREPADEVEAEPAPVPPPDPAPPAALPARPWESRPPQSLR